MHSVTRYHDFSAGHRVVGHESKCRYLHGHNYRVHFTCVAAGPGDKEWDEAPELDEVGRVIDFSVIKSLLCEWLEENWDHRMLIWRSDQMLTAIFHTGLLRGEMRALAAESIVVVPFNPTAENMAEHLVRVVGPLQLHGTGVILQKVTIEETRKCSATYELDTELHYSGTDPVAQLREHVEYLMSKDEVD